jgi:Family of unknown function (DUF5320)
MPFGDRTGPLGLGPGTGRRMGFCAGFSAPGPLNNPVPGRGWFGSSRGFGCFGRGRGWRNLFRATGLPGWARAGYGYMPLAGVEYPSRPEFAVKDALTEVRRVKYYRPENPRLSQPRVTIKKC